MPWARSSYPQIGERVRVVCVWCERTRHRDPDGVASGGRKILLDGIVKAGRLKNDGAECIAGFTDSFIWDSEDEGVRLEFMGRDGIVGSAFFPYRLPDLNELLALREASARRSVKSSLRGRLV